MAWTATDLPLTIPHAESIRACWHGGICGALAHRNILWEVKVGPIERESLENPA
jgi:hypothetical protein